MAKPSHLKEDYLVEQLKLTQKALKSLQTSFQRSSSIIQLLQKDPQAQISPEQEETLFKIRSQKGN